MPKIEVVGYPPVEVSGTPRLVKAISAMGVDILHACGGNARCTTCRVEFLEGEPSRMTEAERNCLANRGLEGVRLSCQIQCEQDMKVRAVSRLEGSGRANAGPEPADEITPEPVWVKK